MDYQLGLFGIGPNGGASAGTFQGSTQTEADVFISNQSFGIEATAECHNETYEVSIENGNMESAYELYSHSEYAGIMNVAEECWGQAWSNGKHTLVTWAPFVNGVSQAGQSRWLIQEICMVNSLFTFHNEDECGSTASCYGGGLSSMLSISNNTSHFFCMGLIFVGDAPTPFNEFRHIPILVQTSRRYIVPQENGSIEEDVTIFSGVRGAGGAGWVAEGLAVVAVTSRTQSNLEGGGGGGGGGGPIIPD